MAEHVDELFTARRKLKIKPGELPYELYDRKRSTCDCYESCLLITSDIVRTDLKLECTCTCNMECMWKCSNECMLKCNKECMGNKQWLGGHNETVLTYNSHVVDNMNVKILEQSAHNNSIIIRNATQDDLNSIFTCSFGTLSKSISLDGYIEHDNCLHIEPYKVGNDLKLECSCICHMQCMGNTQWTGGQNETVLTFNRHVVDKNREIQIMESTASNNSILIKNAMQNAIQKDLNSDFTCFVGTHSKSFSLDGYIEQSTQASPTVSTVTTTGGQDVFPVTSTEKPDKRFIGGLIAGMSLGEFLALGIALVTIIGLITITWINKRKRPENKPKTEEEIHDLV